MQLFCLKYFLNRGGDVLSKSIDAVELKSLSDEKLVELSKSGNESATDFLIEKYKNFVKAKSRTYFLIGADKEDIIQEGMIGLYKAIRDYNSQKLASFKNFADICVTRQIITAIKTATRQKHIPLNSYISLNKPAYDDESERMMIDLVSEKENFNPEEIMITKEHFDSMFKKMSTVLSDFEWRVMKLFLDGKSYSEIAKKLGKSEKSIDNALQRIKKKVEKHLQNCEE